MCQKFLGTAWPGTCSEVNEIGMNDTARVGRSTLENECGDQVVFIGHANTNMTLGQMAKYAFEKIILASMFEIFVYMCQWLSGGEGRHRDMEKWRDLRYG